jgi:hypothetical protein
MLVINTLKEAMKLDLLNGRIRLVASEPKAKLQT